MERRLEAQERVMSHHIEPLLQRRPSLLDELRLEAALAAEQRAHRVPGERRQRPELDVLGVPVELLLEDPVERHELAVAAAHGEEALVVFGECRLGGDLVGRVLLLAVAEGLRLGDGDVDVLFLMVLTFDALVSTH